MPTKSTGCYTCRKRKIRCDEKRPGCDRCKTHGVTCPGYRQPAPGQIEFADETVDVVRRATKGRKTGSGFTTIEFFNDTKIRSTAKVDANTHRRTTNSSFYDFSQIEDGLLVNTVDAMISRYPNTADGILDEFEFAGSSSAHSSSSGICTPDSDPDLGLFHKETAMDIAKAMALYTTPQLFPSAAAEKAMIYSTFVDTYLPKHRPESDAHFSFLEQLITAPDLRPEVGQALDALSLVQVGSIYKDQSLLKQSVRSYTKALQGLVRTLSNSDTSSFVTDDYVLATVTLLATCEFFDEISFMGEGWSKHIEGSQQLLKARGPKSIQSRMSLMLYSNMRHGALSHALIARKGTFLGETEWRAIAWRDEIRDGSTAFYEYALQVPTLLQSWDEFARKEVDKEMTLDDLLAKAKKLERGLRLWHEDFRMKAKISGKDLYTLMGIEQFPTFCGLVSNRTIDKSFMFTSFMVGYLMCVYWDVMHFLRTTIKKMHHAKHLVEPTWYPDAEETVTEDELMEYVMKMMRCFPFFCEPTSSSTGQIGIFLPLRTAAFYCTEHGHWPLLRWIGEVRDSVFTRGMRPPSVRERRPPGTARIEVSPILGTPVVREGAIYSVARDGSPITFANMIES